MKKWSLLLLFFSLSFYGQNDTISVVRHTNSDIISPKELKVVYRGIPNSLFIEVPNCKSFTASGEGLTKYSKKEYFLNPGIGSEVIITIDIVLNSNKKITENHVFKIRKLSNLVATLNYNDQKFIRLQKNNLKGAILRVKFEDKNLLQDFIIVTKFKLKIPGRKEIEVLGNQIDSKTFELINKYASINDEITICDIGTIIRCGLSIIDLNPIVIHLY
jgi:hypothetical protein